MQNEPGAEADDLSGCIDGLLQLYLRERLVLLHHCVLEQRPALGARFVSSDQLAVERNEEPCGMLKMLTVSMRSCEPGSDAAGGMVRANSPAAAGGLLCKRQGDRTWRG